MRQWLDYYWPDIVVFSDIGRDIIGIVIIIVSQWSQLLATSIEENTVHSLVFVIQWLFVCIEYWRMTGNW